MVKRAMMAAMVIGLVSAAMGQVRTRPSTQPGANPGSSGVSVTLQSAKIDYVALRKKLPDNQHEDLGSAQKLLAITVEISNKSPKEITYKSFNGSEAGDDNAALIGDDKKYLPLARFGDLELVGAQKEVTIKVGESVTDVLCFAVPREAVKSGTLILPAKNHGDAGTWRIEVKFERPE